MENNTTILDELREISPALVNINRKNVYAVEPSYFLTLANEISNRIHFGEERDYNFFSVIPYKVQDGYFENLSKNILNKIKASGGKQNEISEELNEIAPLLNTISKATLFTVPNGYFENLQVSPIHQKAQAKVFTLSKVKNYAVAAVITGVIAISSYLVADKDVTDVAPQAYNVKNEVQNLKDDEIINFLKTSSTRNVTSTYSEKLAPAREIKLQLKEMSDDELQQYLKENPEPDEIEVDI